MPYRILTLNHISPRAASLSRRPLRGRPVGRAPDAILVRSHDMHGWPSPAVVKAIGRAGAGTNNIPVATLSKRGVPVFNAPGANANAVKELVLAALLLAARNVVPALRFVDALDRRRRTSTRASRTARSSSRASSCRNRTLGIVGLGAIGSLVADTAIKLGMRVIGFDPEITVDAAWRLPSAVRKANSIDELLKHLRLRDAARAAAARHAAPDRRASPCG